MIIKGYDLDEKLVLEIGKFTVLWNCFERFQCNYKCNPKTINKIAPNIKINYEKQAYLAEVLNKRRCYFDQFIPDYVESSLHPGASIESSGDNMILMQMFMEQKGDNLNAGCLLVINRIRNNLLHGLKQVEELNNQIMLFEAVNGVLESICI